VRPPGGERRAAGEGSTVAAPLGEGAKKRAHASAGPKRSTPPKTALVSPAPARPRAPRPVTPVTLPRAVSDGVRRVPIAALVKAHGITGELRAHTFNEGSELLRAGRDVWLELGDAAWVARIDTLRETPQGALVRLAGVSDRDAAEALRGARVLVPRSEFPPLEPGEFYFCDLEGARAVLDGATIGTVKGVVEYPTCHVVVVEREGKPTLEVPLRDDFVTEVLALDGVVTLATIDGLE
jgi:16S rRNA processing protein RimM